MDFQVIQKPLSHGPATLVPKGVVIHAMGEYIDFNGKHLHAVELLDALGLSAHYLVTPSGLIIQCRREDQGAWHCKAGGHNYDSIGVEFLLPGLWVNPTFEHRIQRPWVTEPQQKAGFKLCRHLLRKHNGWYEYHSSIDPENKVDPGEGFPKKEFGNFVHGG